MTRKELLAVPKREWGQEIETDIVWVIPSRRKHESGYACMDFVAKTMDGELIGFGGICDSVKFIGDHFHMDCEYPSRIIRIWDWYPFTVSNDISSIYFIEKVK